MRKALAAAVPALFVIALVLSLPLQSQAQNREKFIISARAGGVNAVTGRATMHPRGNSEWQLLTIKEDLETGDVVRTGLDGRVEMLLNPGSYMRFGENSEFELADSSLENLEVRLIRGTAIVEVTGADDQELLIGITTPHTRMSIVRRGLYRVNVVPGDATELIVRRGRVMLDDSHTKIKAGSKVVFSRSSFSVAKLDSADKKDTFEGWSKDRAQALATQSNSISRRTLLGLANSFRNDWSYSGFSRQSGIWLFSPGASCYTFIPFINADGLIYGRFYGYGAGPVYSGVVSPVGSGSPSGSGHPSGSAGSPGAPYNPPSSSGRSSGESPMLTHGKSESGGDGPSIRPPTKE